MARSWPVWLFVVSALSLNVSIPPLIKWLDFLSFDQEIQALFFFAGVVVGECCFVVLISGFTKRTWLGAYLVGLGIAGAGYAAFLCGMWLIDERIQDGIAVLALLPAFLLAATSPLSVLRHSFGWRLVYKGEVPLPRQPLRLADIFSLTAIVAAELVLIRVPSVIWENGDPDYWLSIVITCLILFGTSLIVLPLHARVVFRDSTIATKLAWLVLLAIIIVVVSIGIMQCFFSLNASWGERLDILPYLLTFLGAAIGVFYLSLLLLVASGVRLLRGRVLTPAPGNESTQPPAAHLQRLTWWRIGTAVAFTMATSMYLAKLEQWRAARDKENGLLTLRAEATGGGLSIIDRIPADLTLGPRATDDDFAVFKICNDLQYLDFQYSKITDRGLENLQHFPRLRTLSLNGLRFSDDGLVHLKNLRNLEMLEIVNCDVKGTHIAGLPSKQRLTTLNLTRTQFGDDECELLVEFSNLHSLTLVRNRITDKGVAALSAIGEVDEVSLAENEITDACLPHLATNDLDISGTQITFNGLVTNGLPNVGKLRVGEGHFTQQEMSQLKQQLRLR